jgi:hypothetical protein
LFSQADIGHSIPKFCLVFYTLRALVHEGYRAKILDMSSDDYRTFNIGNPIGYSHESGPYT